MRWQHWLETWRTQYRTAVHVVGRKPSSRRVRRSARVEPLEARFVLAASNIEGNLAALCEIAETAGPTQNGATEDHLSTVGTDAESLNLLRNLLRIDDAGRPLVNIWTSADTPSSITPLTALGAEVVGASNAYQLIEAWVDVADLNVVASLPGVLSITPVYRPISHAGSVQTQGDAIVNADDVRGLGADGSPFLVGVLSDSALNISNSQTTGDLPTVVDRYLEFPADDEGRAMLEIVHDVAPGAGLAHHSVLLGEQSFADGIRKLAQAGAKIIVDDISFFTEPYFQDGIVAQAVNEVADLYGVTYIAAAGNAADLSYEVAFEDATPSDATSDLHDFDSSAGVDTRQQITVPAGTTATLALQWDDPFYTTSGVTHNFDIRVYDSAGTLVTSGVTNNVSTQQPLEVVAWISSGNGIYQVEIQRVAGSGASRLKYVLGQSGSTIDEYATHSGTVVGHATALGAIAVGAVPFYDANNIEPFSSYGDATIYFDSAGNRLATPEMRQKPDLVAPDAVNTTFFGTDIAQDADTFPNFAGTSAAAPHVAGVAALVLDSSPHLTRSELYNILTSTTVDLGGPGRDRIYGFGRVDAEAARIAALAVPDVTAPTAQLRSPISLFGWSVDRAVVGFSEPLDSATATNAGNYILVAAGSDNTFGTADDVSYSVTPSYNQDARTVTLTFTSPTTELGFGQYRLTLDGTNGIKDAAGNSINNGLDQPMVFTIAGKSAVVTIEGASQLDVSPDARITIVYPYNPAINHAKWPQVMVGQFEAGGESQGPFRSVPTDIENSFRVENPDVAVNATGGVIVYSDYDEIIHGEPDFFAMRYQRIDADGRAVGPRMIADYIDGGRKPRTDINASGHFAVTFSDQDYNSTLGSYEWFAKARLFQPDGQPIGPVFTASELSHAQDPVVGVASDGSSVIAWEYSYGDKRDGDGAAVFARRFDSSGTPLGHEFRVNATVLGDQMDAEIAMASDGSFVIAWGSTTGPNGTGGGVFFQRFASDGTPLGSETRVSSQVMGGPVYGYLNAQAQIATAPDGRFVIAWYQEHNAEEKGIFAQRFTANGTRMGGPLWISQDAPGRVQYNINEAPSTLGLGITDHGDFVASWVAEDGAARIRWCSWNASDDPLPFGPWVRTLTHDQPEANSISSAAVTFDRPINASTFTTADVALIDPAGRTVTVGSVTTTDHQTFNLSFDSQQLRGRYSLRVGSDIQDEAGNAMDQNGNTLVGESQDAFRGLIERVSIPAAGIPQSEDFESGSIDSLAARWSFAATAGTIDVSTSNNPHSGSYHLRMLNPANSGTTTTREAVLALDLSGQVGATNLALDFWTQALVRKDANNLSISVSGDGSIWTVVPGGSNLSFSALNQYQHYAFDLDAALTAANIVLDGDVYIKLEQSSYYSGSGLTFDDVRVSNADAFGPKIVSQTPSIPVSSMVSSLTVTFNEAIDTATFTAEDVTVNDPSGAPVALAGNPVDNGDHRTFTISFSAEQVLRGTYTFKIGQDVFDVAGNPMNQDGDVIVGETNGDDRYGGILQVGGVTGTAIPYSQDFEAGTLTALASNWSFAAISGRVEVTAIDNPHGGSNHLRMTNLATNEHTQREAVLKLDLSDQAGANNLSVDFWVQKKGQSTSSNYFALYVSGDGINFTQVGSNIDPVTRNQYLHYAWDLDQILTSAAMAIDGDVYLKILHNAFYSGDVMTFDDLRIRSGAVNNAPTLTTISTLTGAMEDESFAIDYATLVAAADEADANGDTLSFRVEAVTSGTLTKNGEPVVMGNTLLSAGDSFVWTPAADANGTLNAFTLRVWDGDLASGTAVTVKVVVAAVNDAPILDNSGNPTLTAIFEDATNPSGNTVSSIVGSSISDIDTSALKGVAVVGLTGAENGIWQYSTNSGSTWNAFGAVSEDGARLLRDTDRVRYVPNANFNGTATIDYRAWDRAVGDFGSTADLTAPGATGGMTAFSTTTETASIAVKPVNDAPVLNNTGTMTLDPIAEDDAGNNGTLVSMIIASAGGDRITDIDASALEGIAVTAVVNTNGAWQYSTDDGTTWLPFGTPSTSAARLLAANSVTRVRLVPNPNLSGVIANGITFRAWDQSSGSNGGTASVSSSGGTTAFSTASESADITITPVNDSPILDNSIAPSLATIQEDAIVFDAAPLGAEVEPNDDGTIGGAVSDLAFANDLTGSFVSTGITTYQAVVNGQISSGDDVDWDFFRINAAPGDSLTVALDGTTLSDPIVRLFNQAGVQIASDDDGGPGNNSLLVFSSFSDAGDYYLVADSYSSRTGTYKLTATLTTTRSVGSNMVGSLLGTSVTDVDGGGAARGIAVVSLSDTASGTWQYLPASASQWQAFGTVSESAARLLRDADRVRFVPNPNFSGTVTMDYRAWDQTTGVAGDTADLSSPNATGASTAFSMTVETASLTVTLVNDPPTISDVADQSTNQNTATSAIPFTVSDVETSTASLIVTTSSSNTTLVPDANIVLGGSGSNRTVRVTPASNQTGTATITLTVSDGSSTASDTFVLTVNAVNVNPVITSATAVNVAENNIDIVTVTAADTDQPVQTVTFSLVDGGDQSQFNLTSGGVLTFKTTPDFETPTDTNADNVYVVQVQASDGNGGTATQTINVTVTAVNDNSPMITSANAVNIAENTTSVLTMTATDADLPAQTVSFSIVGGADQNKFNITSGGVLAFASAPDVEAPTDANGDNVYVVQVQADDGNGGTTTQTINVTVTAVNDNDPVITSSATVNVPENTISVLTVTATDADLPPPTLTFAIVGGADQGKFNLTGGVLTFASAPDFDVPGDANGDNIYVVQVRASDGTRNSATQTINVTVTGVNDNDPVITSSATVNVPESTSGVLTVTATDADALAQTVTFALVGGTDQTKFNITSGGVLAFASAPDFEAPTDANGDNVYVVQVQANDGNGGTATQTINVTVTAVNDNDPVITSSATVNVAENTSGVLTVTATDADVPAQALTFAIVGGADQGKFNLSGGVLTFASAPDFDVPGDANGDNVYVVQVRASDGSRTSATQTINVTVTAVNDNDPVITSSATVNVAENTASVLTVTATDADLAAPTLTLAIVGGADQGKFNLTGGVLTFISAPNFEAPTDANGDNEYIVQVQVSDGTRTATQTIHVAVTAVNEFDPVITSAATASIAENTASVLTVAATDADLPAQMLNFVIVGGVDQDKFNLNDGVLTFASAPDFDIPSDANSDNIYVVQVRASDGSRNSATQTINVIVTEINDNDPIIISSATLNVPENTIGVLTVTATDADRPIPELTFSKVGGADQAKFSLVGGVLTFASAPDFETPADADGDNVYVVQVRVSDGSRTTTQTIHVTVTDVLHNPLSVDLPEAGGPFTARVIGQNFHLRQANGSDLISPTPLSDVSNVQINGSSAADVVVVDSSLSAFVGTFGFSGGNGADKLDATRVNVSVTMDGGVGNDTLLGGGGNDVFFGGADNDSASGGDGNDSLSGGNGKDTLKGESGTDLLDETVVETVVLSSTSLKIGTITDKLSGFESASLSGGDNNDSIKATVTYPVTLVGGAGNDSLTGGSANDLLFGSGDNDLLNGGKGADRLNGDAGDDTLTGGVGSDSLIGGNGIDQLKESGNLNFTLTGASLIGVGTGGSTDSLSEIENASLTGGSGNNTLDASGFSLGGVTLVGGGGNDSLVGSIHADSLNGGAGKDTLVGGDGNDTLTGGAGNDSLDGGADTDRLVETGNVNLTLAETQLAGLGIDALVGFEEAFLIGGSGSNKLTVTTFTGRVTLVGAGGKDTLIGGSNNDVLFGGDGDDSINGGDGEDVLSGGAGKDTLKGDDADDTILGGAGADKLFGGSGSDTLSGEADNDTLDGGDGADALYGGAGVDSPAVAPAGDTLDVDGVFAFELDALLLGVS